MRTTLMIICLLSTFSNKYPYSTETPRSEYHPKRLIVNLNFPENTSKVNIEQALKQLKYGQQLENIKLLNQNKETSSIWLLEFNTLIPIEEIKIDYEQYDFFNYVEYDYRGYGGGVRLSEDDLLPNDQYFIRQWGLENNGTFSLSSAKPGADIKMTSAWEITTGSPTIIIAVLDSGLKLDHPEFQDRIWENTKETENEIDDDQNGYINDLNGWDFANADNDPTDDHGHGTNVTGIACATGNNSLGYAGVNWYAKVMPLKILDEQNYGYYSWWIEAIYYAVDNGADVINMSVGGNGNSQAMREAVQFAYEKNVPVIACMMNENGSTPYYPAAYPETIAVGATDPDDRRSSEFPWNTSKGSNYGEHIDLTAPGNYIYGLSFKEDYNFDTYWSGTSQAAPLVTGVTSLLRELNPDISVEEIRNILRDSSDDQVGIKEEDTPGWDIFHGAGRLNAFKALSLFTSIKEDIGSDHSYNVYPNPINKGDLLTIDAILFNGRIEILNSAGKTIFAKKSNRSKIFIETKNLLPGTYFVMFKDKKKVEFRKFILL